jgi:hypothetical protein
MAVAHNQTARTSAPFVDSLRPLFPYLRCVRKGATIPLEVVHAPPGNRLRISPPLRMSTRRSRIRHGFSAIQGKESEASARAAGKSNGRASFEVLVVGYRPCPLG